MHPRNRRRLHFLAVIGLGQTLLFGFAWGFLSAALVVEDLSLPDRTALLLSLNPSETTLVVTALGTLLSTMTMFFFCTAFKEALRHRMRRPMRLIRLKGAIHIASVGYLISFRHLRTSLVTVLLFVETKLLTSSWSTLLTPTFIARDFTIKGRELDLNNSYFELELQNQSLETGSAIPGQDNSLKIIDIDGLLSGVNTAQYSFGVRGVIEFNGDIYNVSTGGVLPAVSQSVVPKPQAPSNATGLNFVAGSISNQTTLSSLSGLGTNWTILQQGLTADVRCSQISPPGNVTQQVQSPIPVSVFSGNSVSLVAYSYSMPCDRGISAKQEYVLRVFEIPPTGLMYSLVCPYPLDQSQLDWTRFNVTSQGTGRYNFMQMTTCEIVPKLTTSRVTYAYGSLNVNVVNSTVLTSDNTNLALFLAGVVDFQSRVAQGLLSNSIGDALYTIAVSNNVTLNDSGPMNPRLIEELEQYWRGVIEFTGTYLRSGFSASPVTIPTEASTPFNGNKTVTSMGWAKRSPTNLYTVIPVTFFTFLTYAAIGYSAWRIHTGDQVCTSFDPTDPLHLIAAASSSVQDNLPTTGGDNTGGFHRKDIRKDELRNVQFDERQEDGKGHIRFVGSANNKDLNLRGRDWI